MTEFITCYLLDDEPPASLVLSKFIGRIPHLQLVGQSTDPFEGLEQVQALKPSVLFLDVEMPDMNGVAFLRLLAQPHPLVIMVTSSPQYAADTYNFEAVTHYLLKPVGYDKFMEAISRIIKRLNYVPTESRVVNPVADPREGVPYFLIKEDRKLVRVAPEDIVFVEGMRDYVQVHLTTRVLITHMTMNKLESILPPSQFLRVNRSYIVRRQAIREIDGNLITTFDGKRVAIGVTYREAVMRELKKNTL